MSNRELTGRTTLRAAAGTAIAIALITLTACNGSGDRKTDRRPPTVTIETPTTAANYLTASSPIALTGIASDNRRVVSVEWQNAANGLTGIATGTDAWTADIPLVLGANAITVTAVDKRGNAGSDTITVTLDDVLPVITIDTPTPSPTHLTDTTPLALSGTASDNDLVNVVNWENADTIGSGMAAGTTSWSASVPLTPGDNAVSVKAEDLAGNMGSDSILVTLDVTRPLVEIDTPTRTPTYDSPTTPIIIGGTAWDDAGLASVDWSNAATGLGGMASGTSPWTASIDLLPGPNPIIVSATDLLGNVDTDGIVVTLCTSTALAWGENGSGQLADGTTTDRTEPVATTAPTGVIGVAAGNLHTVILLCDGTVWQWGSGNSTPAQVLDPSDPTGFLTAVDSVAAGSDHTLAVIGDGTLRAWGQNNEGQLGDGTVSGGSPTPVQVVDPSDPSGFLTGVVAVDGGGAHSVALLDDGTLRSWGRNAEGQLGDGTNAPSPVPLQVVDPSDPSGFLTGVADVSAHSAHTLAVLSDGTVRAWGDNQNGRLGDGTVVSSPLPVQVIDPPDPTGFLTGVSAVSAGQAFSLALLQDGTVRAWGRNLEGQLGDGTMTERHQPVGVVDPLDPSGFLTGITEIAAGWNHALARVGTGQARSWGANIEGRLGDGTTMPRSAPVRVIDTTDPTGILARVKAIAAGGSHSAALQ